MMDLLQFDRLLQTDAHFLPEAHGRAQEDDHLLLKLEDVFTAGGNGPLPRSSLVLP